MARTAVVPEAGGELAERCRDVPLQAVYTSDLSRAMRTAEGVARFHPELAPQTDLRLREICMGVWEEQPWGNLEHDSPEQLYLAIEGKSVGTRFYAKGKC